jgi:hypothetical protein
MKHITSSSLRPWTVAAACAALLVFALPSAAHAMEIVIAPASDSTFTLEVEPSDSIENLRTRIQDYEGLDPASQRLVYDGQRLQDGQTLSDYNIQAHDTVALVELVSGRAAQTINVTTTSGGSCTWATQFSSCTLQEALNAAGYAFFDDTTIEIGSGTYQDVNSWSYAPTFIGQTLALIGAGRNSTFIENTNEESSDVMDLAAGGPLTVRGITFQSGSVGLAIQDFDFDGDVRFDVTIDDCVFKENTDGGLNVQNLYLPGSLQVTRSQFLNNTRPGVGAGLYAAAGHAFPITIGGLSVSDGNIFDGNTSTGASGGAMYVDVNADGSPISILHTTFTDNSADAYGGALFGYASEGLDMRFNTFRGNFSNGAGAAINLTLDGSSSDTADYVISSNTIADNTSPSPINISNDNAGAFTMDNNTITGNVSTGQGSQIIFSGSVPKVITLRNNLVAHNRSATNGGALILGSFFSEGNTWRIINNTIADNTATSYGAGGLYISNDAEDTWDIYNNIFWGNSGSEDVDDIEIEDDRGTVFNFKYNMYQGVFGNGQRDNGTDFLNIDSGFVTAANLRMNPLFVDSETGDYSLQGTSRAIDSALASAPSMVSVDQNGNPRGTTPDRGAYEYVASATTGTGTRGGYVSGGAPTPVTIAVQEIQKAQKPLVRTLRLGMSGDDVKELQKLLNQKGFAVAASGPGSQGQETKLFGLRTYRAVVAFQKAHNLKPDGVVGPKTWAMLTRDQS